MTRVPPSALVLSVAGLIPFLFGAVVSAGLWTASMGDPNAGGYELLAISDGRLIMTRYGVIILCFMSGVLWGFATKAEGAQATAGYILSVLPALWAFLNPGVNADEALLNLIVGFVGVLLIDYAFHRWALCPPWWLALRIPLTIAVVICLGIGIWA